ILNVFLWLKFSPSLILNKIEHFETASLYYELESNSFGKNEVSKDKSKKISTKKEGLELTNANWVPIYSVLTAEVNHHP
ncbi:MAG: hypothetical protein KKB35_05880, partial [Proteobacteria bacterium]|nr:hypothetical protein [Pseudomonadota bacterium]